MSDNIKICSKCKKEKLKILFRKNRNQCNDCFNEVRRLSSKNKIIIETSLLKEYKHQWYLDNKKEISDKCKLHYLVNRENRLRVAKENYYKNFSSNLIRSLRQRAKKFNLEFSLDKEFIEQLYNNQNGKCLITGVEFNFDKNKCLSRRPFAPSIDRINSKLGYTKDNVRLICVAVNLSLNEFGDEVFDKICRAYVENTIRCQ